MQLIIWWSWGGIWIHGLLAIPCCVPLTGYPPGKQGLSVLLWCFHCFLFLFISVHRKEDEHDETRQNLRMDILDWTLLTWALCLSTVRHSCPKAKLTKSGPRPFPKGQIPHQRPCQAHLPRCRQHPPSTTSWPWRVPIAFVQIGKRIIIKKQQQQQPFIESLLFARHCAKCFACIIIISHNNPMK